MENKSVEKAAEEHSKQQGLNYPVGEPYRQMIASQINYAFLAGAEWKHSSLEEENKRLREVLLKCKDDFDRNCQHASSTYITKALSQ